MFLTRLFTTRSRVLDPSQKMAFFSTITTTTSNQQSYSPTIDSHNSTNNKYTALQPGPRTSNSTSQQWRVREVSNICSPPPLLNIPHVPQSGKKLLQLCSPTNHTPTVPLQKKRNNKVDLGDLNQTSPSPSKSLTNPLVGREEYEGCICERPAAMIICRRCGSELYGHVQRVCQVHPKRINLMDHKECSFCRSIHLSEIHAPLTNGKTNG